MEKLIVIDGNSLANRAYYAMPYLTNKNKEPSGAVFGFANLLVKIITEQKPNFLIVAFDHARKTFRNEIYADYKGTRKGTPEDLLFQFPVIKRMLQVMGIKIFESEGIEADDIIGTIVKSSKFDNIIVSGDRDLLQLIDEHTKVWLTRKGVTEIESFDEEALFAKYGLKPSGIIDLKALMGDASDNIPGVAGVGEKTALSLLSSYKTLEGVYDNVQNVTGKLKDKLIDGKDSAFMSKTLATIKTDCDLDFAFDDCKFDFPFSSSVRDFFEEWDFRSLLNRDIFSEKAPAKKSETTKQFFQSSVDVQKFAGTVKDVLCLDLNAMEFSCGDGNVFAVKKEIDLFSDYIDLQGVVRILQPLFESDKVQKITNNSKQDMKFLKGLGIKYVNFFDVDIASYVLYAGMTKQQASSVEDFDNLRRQYQDEMKKENVDKIYEEIEIPLVGVLANMEESGFKVDEDMLSDLGEKFDSELQSITARIYELAGEQFNINSPKQVARILFDKLGLKSWNNKKQSTNFAVLDDMRWQHEIVDLIISHRKVSKIVSTYVNVYKNICATSGPVIHTLFNQTVASTGRLSSSEPNLQNIPTRDEEGRKLRKIFVSKFENGKLVSADYNQIELRLLANLADEESMIEAYRHGVDIHTKTASEIFGVPVEAVTSAQRRDAKAVNFGIIYGISDYGLSQNIKTSVGNAKNYIDCYFDRYPKIKTFMDGNVEFAKEHGFVRSYFGRVRHIPEIKASNSNIRKFGERVAMNMPLQGTASDVIKIAMIEISKQLEGMKSHIILQIHDELIVDAPQDEVQEVQKILKKYMESVCNFTVPLTVSVTSGNNLFECK